jgi:hypothetical protein
MKKFITVSLSLLLTCSALFAQYFKTDTIYIPFSKQGKFIFCDTKEKILINKLFDYAEPFRAGYAVTGKKTAAGKMLLGVIDKKGKQILPYKFLSIEFKQYEGEKTKENPYSLFFYVDDGFKTFTYKGIEKDIKEDVYHVERTDDEKFIYQTNGKYGAKVYSDTIPAVYDFLEQPAAWLIIFIATKDGKMGLITSSDKKLVPLIYNNIQWSQTAQGFVLREESQSSLGFYYYRTSNGPQVIVPCKYKSILNRFGEKFLQVKRLDGTIVYVNLVDSTEYNKK